MIKVWAKIYQLTGWYCPIAKVEEYSALKKWLRSDMGREHVKTEGCIAILMFIGSWQADNGFYRTFKKIK